MNFRNKICWITGASSGIGEAMCLELARQNAILVLSARNKDKLQEVAEKCMEMGAKDAHVIPLDLGLESSIDTGCQEFMEKFDRLDVLVNNGGISQRALAYETSYEIERKIMQVNYFGTVYLTKKMLPLFIKQKFGHLAVTSSIAGKFGFPLRTTYAASKHAVQGYFESLRIELIPFSIAVSIIIPGRVRTEISNHALDGNGVATEKMDPGLDNGIAVEAAARKIIKGLVNQRKEILVGGKELLMVYLRRYAPWLYYRIVSKINPT